MPAQGLLSSESFCEPEGDSDDSERLVHSAAYFLSRRSQASNHETWDQDSEFNRNGDLSVDSVQLVAGP